MSKKEKTDKLDLVKIKNFVLQGIPTRNEKTIHRMGEHICKSYAKDFYLALLVETLWPKGT